MSACPIPPPISRYQLPAPLFGSRPAAFHNRNSSAFVPLRSPRETNGPSRLANRRECGGGVLSALDLRRIRLRPDDDEIVPSDLPRLQAVALADEFLLGLGVCTRTRSASPRPAVSSAWPVPCASTCTVMPVALVNCGRIAPSSPELSTEVVEVRRIVCASWAARIDKPGRTAAVTASQTGAEIASWNSLPYCGRPASAKAAALIRIVSPINTRPRPSASAGRPCWFRAQSRSSSCACSRRCCRRQR